MTTNKNYDRERWVLFLLTQTPESIEQGRRFLDLVEDNIRNDERLKVASFIENLGLKLSSEFSAYREYLEGNGKDSPEQIKLELPM